MAHPDGARREVGLVFFFGPVFRGCHCVTLHQVGDGRRTLDIRVDGMLRRPKTVRGLRALLARKIASKVNL